MSRLNIFLIVLFIAIFGTASSALFIVNETQQALVVQFGESILQYLVSSNNVLARSN